MNTFVDHNGLTWVNGGPTTDDHLAFGGHEPGLIELAKGMLPENGVFLDIGAHVGLYTLNLASKARLVIAIEANAETYKVLSANVEENVDRVPATVIGRNFAAWDCYEELRMLDENDKETGGSTRCVPDVSTKDSLKALSWTTQGMPLDDALEDFPKIDFVKIDVEGAEARVLKGMQRRISRDKPVLLIEMHDMYFGEAIRTDTIAVLEAADYAWNDALTFGGSYYIVARPADDIPDFTIETVKAGQ